MRDYAHLQGQFRKVRRSWKRAAALSGLAMVLLESIGIFTLVILLSLFYGHIPWVRFGLFTAATAVVIVLAVRHIALPVTRRIPDEQIALYVEEHDDHFEGALITAAEFARKTGISPLQTKMIRAIIHAADARAERRRLSSIVSFARLRKYGVAALISLAVYVVMCAAFPTTVGRHVVGVLQPWRAEHLPGGAPVPPGLTLAEARRLQPIEFALSKGDCRVPRGQDFELEVQLSREPDGPVLLEFRPVGEPGAAGAWQQLPMEQIEKLHGYARRLESVSEDMDFRVSSGPYVCATHRITVYDRIELHGVQITTQFPDYLRFVDRVEELSSGDVSAPIGSKVTVRVLVNTELASGRLVWDDGTQQPLAVDPARKSSALASFRVERSRRYSFEATDVDGQVARSLGASEVYALKDNPPTIDLLQPTGELETHPLAEVAFHAKVSDDYGTDRVDLVYLRISADGQLEGRLPLGIERPRNEEVPLPEIVDARALLLLEEARPPYRPGEVISWHLEARDRKPDNPPAMSDLHMIVILPFELWGAYEFQPGEAPGPVMSGEIPVSLGQILMETWDLHRRKPALTQKDYEKQCEEIADRMVSPNTGEVYDLGKAALPLHPSPRMVEAARRAQKHAVLGHEALLNFNTAEAVKQFSLGIAELLAAGITDTEALRKEGPAPEGGMAAGGGAARQQQQSRLLEMFAEVKLELEDKAGAKLENSLNKAEAAARARAAVQDVRKQQQGVINQAKELGKAGGAPQAQELGKLAQREQALAHKARATAGELKSNPIADEAFQKTGDKIDRAATAMRSAAGQLNQGRAAEGVTKAAEADKLLGEAEGELQEMRHEQLETALAEAESLAETLLRDQGEVRRDTQAVDNEAASAAGAKLTPKHKRDLRKIAFRQVKVKARFETFSGKMDRLRQWAEDSSRSDTARHVLDAHRVLKRLQPGQKMANSVVELDGFHAKAAAVEQQKAEAALARTLAKLQAASDTLAATREEGLRRAVREAKAIEKGVEQIAVADEAGKGGKGGDEGGQGGKGGDQGGQGGKGGDQGGQGGKGGQGGGAGLMSPQQRRNLSGKIASGVRRLNRQLQTRNFGLDLNAEAQLLQRVARDDTLEAKLVSDSVVQRRLRDVIARVSDKLEAELAATTKAKRILSAQQEDCPPRYRHLVNKYYEALSRRQR